MPLTPVEIRHIDLRRAWLRGYRRPGVDELLTEIADSFEEVWRERADLSDRLEELEAEAAKHRELEALLRSTLVSAERAAQDMKEQARRESDLIVQEAHAESRRVTRESAAEKRRLEDDDRQDPRSASRCARVARRLARRQGEQEGGERERRSPRPDRAIGEVARQRNPQGRGLATDRARAGADILRAVKGPRTSLRLRVVPGAPRSGIVGRTADAWKVRIAAAPGGRQGERGAARPSRAHARPPAARSRADAREGFPRQGRRRSRA